MNQRSHGPWTILSSQVVYEDPWINVQRDEVLRPDGDPGSYSTVRLKSGVCVVAIDSDECVHLTKEFHYAVGRTTIEGVSGGIEADEGCNVAARRELAEELGLVAEQWNHLGKIDPFTAAIFSEVDLFVATELTQHAANPEGTEEIEHVVFPLKNAVQMVRDGTITHAPTCVILLQMALDRLQG
ncbi:MAG: NUDIX domain-containing protein [Aureliella sp.]